MSTKNDRSPETEMAAWKRRVAALAIKESKCPGCKKAARLAYGTLNPKICETHRRIRVEMVFGKRRMG